jgi:hypothetical protein
MILMEARSTGSPFSFLTEPVTWMLPCAFTATVPNTNRQQSKSILGMMDEYIYDKLK